jgi:hypothetical protein
MAVRASYSRGPGEVTFRTDAADGRLRSSVFGD